MTISPVKSSTTYLELLDPSRVYFLASDIESFERYRSGLDDALSAIQT